MLKLWFYLKYEISNPKHVSPNHPEMCSQFESHECFRIKASQITTFTGYILHEKLSSQHIGKYKRNITGSPLKEIIIHTHNQED